LARRRLESEQFTWEDGVLDEIYRIAEWTAAQMGEHFGNARWLNNFLDQSLSRMRSRVVRSQIPPQDPQRRRLLVEDLRDEGTAQESRLPPQEMTLPLTSNCNSHITNSEIAPAASPDTTLLADTSLQAGSTPSGATAPNAIPLAETGDAVIYES
jgi:hypothetical protein